MNDLSPQARKILYRCTHRGTKELDLMLGSFARAFVPQMDAATLAAFADFTELPEPLLLECLIGKHPLPATLPAGLAQMLRTYRYQPEAR